MDPVEEIIYYPVPAEQWQDYVDAFKASSGITPNPASPYKAVFKLNDAVSVHVIEEGGSELKPGIPSYAGLKSENDVEIFVRYFGYKRADVQVVTAKNEGGGPDKYTINMATRKIPKKGATSSDAETQDTSGSTSTVSGSPDSLEVNALEGGVIHNPPQMNLMQQSGTVEATSEQ